MLGDIEVVTTPYRGRDNLTITLEREAAEYVASLCEDHYRSANDMGGKFLAEEIRRAYSDFDARTSSGAGNE